MFSIGSALFLNYTQISPRYPLTGLGKAFLLKFYNLVNSSIPSCAFCQMVAKHILQRSTTCIQTLVGTNLLAKRWQSDANLQQTGVCGEESKTNTVVYNSPGRLEGETCLFMLENADVPYITAAAFSLIKKCEAEPKHAIQ